MDSLPVDDRLSIVESSVRTAFRETWMVELELRRSMDHLRETVRLLKEECEELRAELTDLRRLSTGGAE